MTGSQLKQDWFMSAIVKDGNVSDCLFEVLAELKKKEDFVVKLRARIGERNGSKFDAVSEISTRIRILEGTLKFRLSILSPDRRGAWFRTNVTTASGPFAGTVLPEAVFSGYDESKTSLIRLGLVDCWNKRNLTSYPLKATESCLWKILLVLNFELYQLGEFGDWPRLEFLPERLPVELESRSLRAFLSNVKSEYVSARERLKNCYDLLIEASDLFWMAASAPNPSKQTRDSYDGYEAADSVRESFKKRRSSPTIKRPIGKTSQDIEALKFMGFEDFPDAESLKHRYHSLARSMHPDREGGNESKFKHLAKCYQHLNRICIRT